MMVAGMATEGRRKTELYVPLPVTIAHDSTHTQPLG